MNDWTAKRKFWPILLPPLVCQYIQTKEEVDKKRLMVKVKRFLSMVRHAFLPLPLDVSAFIGIFTEKNRQWYSNKKNSQRTKI